MKILRPIAASATIALAIIALDAVSQDMPREWSGEVKFGSSTRGIVNSVRLSITSTESDGSIRGKLYWGGVLCRPDNLPFDGTFHDGVLRIKSEPVGKYFSGCPKAGPITITVSRTVGGEGYEGIGGIKGFEHPIFLKAN